jgi:hypothetical protein
MAYSTTPSDAGAEPAADAMKPRLSFWTATAFIVAAVVARTFPFVWWPNAHFDSDQAIVGLMAKHISEGRAWPLYFYGQNYMLAVEPYLAAPVMWGLGPTVLAVKLPLVIINVAAALLLFWLLVREARLSPWVAVIPVLPIALPAAVIAARTTEAMGGNVEPWLYILLLWWARDRPFAFGTILGVGILHREFTAYGAAAILVMDALGLAAPGDRRRYLGDRLRHWSLVGVIVVSTRVAAAALQPFASTLGPGTTIDDRAVLASTEGSLSGRVCFQPDTWSVRVPLLIGDHLPRLVGGVGAALQDYGVQTGVYSGQDGLFVWVAAITLAGLLGGAWYWWQPRSRGDADAVSHLGGYLVLVGTISTVVYGFVACSRIAPDTLRYNLLALFIPVGALVMALQTWRQPAVRAGFGAAVALWCLVNSLDVLALAREYRQHRPEDRRLALAEALEARGVEIARAPFRTAYHVTFLAREKVRVAATDYPRIRAYDEEAARSAAPTIADRPCPDGSDLPGGLFLCPAEGGSADAR